MKSIVTFLFLFVVGPAFAADKTAVIGCNTKAYNCWRTLDGINECGWVLTSPIVERSVRLRKDPNFPSPDKPYEVWRGQLRTDTGGHDLIVEIEHSAQDLLHPFKLNARLSDNGYFAETSGTDRIDIGLRVDRRGRGYFCPSIRLVP